MPNTITIIPWPKKPKLLEEYCQKEQALDSLFGEHFEEDKNEHVRFNLIRKGW